MLKPILRYMPHELNIDTVGWRFSSYLLTAILLVGSIVSLSTRGLNFGIDFAGGMLIEVRHEQQLDEAALRQLRSKLEALHIGEPSVNTLGSTGKDASVRLPQQEGGEQALNAAVQKVTALLQADGFDIRQAVAVGPKVGGELIISSALAVALAIIAIAIYVWFRFEWQFALGAVLALCHDVLTTVGLFSILWLNFDLTAVAAILTIAGYSVNDTVVVYDRVREMLRKYRKMPLPELLNVSVNRVLPRTLLTVFTVLLTVIALILLAPPALQGFSIALLWGLFVGTFSSIRVGMPVLLYFDLRRDEVTGSGHVEGGTAKQIA